MIMDPLLDLFSNEDGNERKDSLPPEVNLFSTLVNGNYFKFSFDIEVEEGNVEYKLKLLNPSTSRFEHLVTQMKWRLQEGRGEAIYEIGVADSGVLTGLNKEELKISLDTLNRMAQR